MKIKETREELYVGNCQNCGKLNIRQMEMELRTLKQNMEVLEMVCDMDEEPEKTKRVSLLLYNSSPLYQAIFNCVLDEVSHKIDMKQLAEQALTLYARRDAYIHDGKSAIIYAISEDELWEKCFVQLRHKIFSRRCVSRLGKHMEEESRLVVKWLTFKNSQAFRVVLEDVCGKIAEDLLPTVSYEIKKIFESSWTSVNG